MSDVEMCLFLFTIVSLASVQYVMYKDTHKYLKRNECLLVGSDHEGQFTKTFGPGDSKRT